jgi:arsenite methyltransferase
MTQLNLFLRNDELPLWSAPFGLTLLDTINYKKGINVLDIGSGTGFPMLEIAERTGDSTTVYGIDPSEESFQMISEKIKLKGISNAKMIRGIGEQLPFPDNYFGLIVSNNGLNNVQDEQKVLQECFRVLEKDGQIVLTMNLPHTMEEFYVVFAEELISHGLKSKVIELEHHIHAKRKPVEYWKECILGAGFSIRSINADGFKMKFADGTAFMNHYLIRTAFRKPWEEITTDETVFKSTEDRLNQIAAVHDGLSISIPHVCFDCFKS